jgi:hypothetical protein
MCGIPQCVKENQERVREISITNFKLDRTFGKRLAVTDDRQLPPLRTGFERTFENVFLNHFTVGDGTLGPGQCGL